MLNRKGLTEFGNLLGKDDHSIFFFEITVYIFLPLVYNEPVNRYKELLPWLDFQSNFEH